jgi:hypothetical protein
VRITGRKLLWVDLLVLEALVFGLTIFLTDASSGERYVVWALMVLVPVLAYGTLLARRS